MKKSLTAFLFIFLASTIFFTAVNVKAAPCDVAAMLAGIKSLKINVGSDYCGIGDYIPSQTGFKTSFPLESQPGFDTSQCFGTLEVTIRANMETLQGFDWAFFSPADEGAIIQADPSGIECGMVTKTDTGRFTINGEVDTYFSLAYLDIQRFSYNDAYVEVVDAPWTPSNQECQVNADCGAPWDYYQCQDGSRDGVACSNCNAAKKIITPTCQASGVC